MTSSLRFAALGVAALALTVGCTRAPAQPIGSVDVPSNANLSGIRSVAVSLTAKAARPGAPALSSLELRRSDGGVVYVSTLRAGTTLAARVALPTKDSSLTAVLRDAAGNEQTLQLAVNGDTASGAF